jgi:gamma-glutamyl:cysteine ligase YbdK (ATP-grasp superfamily)
MQTEFSMFGAIATATEELNREAHRIKSDARDLEASITCGELENILENARKSTHLLRKISFAASIEERLCRVERELFGEPR